MTVVGLAQLTTVPGAVDANRELLADAVGRATSAGADVVVLPELAVSGYTLDPRVLTATAEPVPGPTTEAWGALAQQSGALILGGLCEQDGKRLFNTVVGVAPEGLVLHYRKLHLFAGEKQVFSPGDLGLPIAETPHGRVGVCVCYDLRFPEVVRVLALRDAELIAVPSAWVAGFDSDETRTHGCPQSDGAQLQANLSQVYLACASQAGPGDGFDFLGSSLVAGPDGTALVGPRSRTEQWIGTCEVDLAAAERSRDRGGGVLPRQDRRTDVYGLCYEGRQL